MDLLIVHRDADVGEQLVQMVKDYTAHECDLVGSDVAALDWGRRHARCALLLVQLEGDGIDGLAVGGGLSEIFPGLQTLFLPPYQAAEQRLVVAKTKVFPEPIDGEGLLEAIARAETPNPGAPDLFHVADVLQMCCLSRRSGALQIVKANKSGIAFLRAGQIVHAETTGARGRDALFEIVGWQYVEFAYDKTVLPPVETITSPWDEILIEAVERQKQCKTEERRSA
jgi:Domain of unknown function (DUF4388)